MPENILPTDENLSERQLRWGKWWLLHRHQVKAASTVALAVIAAILVGYGSWGFLDWFFGSGVRERAQIALLTKNLTPYTQIHEANAPSEIVIEPVTTVASGDDTYDIIARMTNANEKWWATFRYRFTGTGLDGRERTGYILPAEQKYLRQLAMESGGTPAVSLELTELSWHRVNNHVVRPDYRTWAGARLDIRISDAEFLPPAPESPIPVSKARFTVTNATAFSYHDVTFFITLYSGNRIVGVNQIVASGLRAGEKRQMEASWFNALPNVTRVEIQPEVNIFDDRVYIAPEG